MMLVFAAIGDNRLNLVDRITTETAGKIQFDSATPLGFFQDEVTLFYPLLARQLNLKAAFSAAAATGNRTAVCHRALAQPLLGQVCKQVCRSNSLTLGRRE